MLGPYSRVEPLYPIFSPNCISDGTILAGYQSRQMPDSGTLGKAWRISSTACQIHLFHFWSEMRRTSAIPPEETWAGDRIVCPGDYHEDLPAGMLTTSEQEELEKAEDEEGGMELYSFTRERYQYVDSINGYNRSEQNDQNWVLRNLSKHGYVREVAIKVNSFDRGDNSFPFGEIGLGQVLLSCICWSTDDSCAMRYEEDIHRGVWAGNRFDITTIDQFKLVDGEKESAMRSQRR